jgi:hypothetical protein
MRLSHSSQTVKAASLAIDNAAMTVPRASEFLVSAPAAKWIIYFAPSNGRWPMQALRPFRPG